MRRRTLLAAGLAGTAALLAGPRRARAAWGTWPEEHLDLALPPGRAARRVLELYVYGGLCPWDSFYCAPAWGEQRSSIPCGPSSRDQTSTESGCVSGISP